MKKKILIIGACFLVLFAWVKCDQIWKNMQPETTNEKQEKVAKERKEEKKEKRKPTSWEIQVLRDCNYESKEIAYSIENGMSSSTQEFVDMVRNTLAFLKNKYGQEFKAYGGTVGDLLSDTHEVYAYATTVPMLNASLLYP